jgi:hypothetical protein
MGALKGAAPAEPTEHETVVTIRAAVAVLPRRFISTLPIKLGLGARPEKRANCGILAELNRYDLTPIDFLI